MERDMDHPDGGRSERFDELYDRARALEPEARAAFLADACGGDAALERELGSLLVHQERAEAFFTNLAETAVPPVVGHQVGQYRITGVLGSGGMGTVYRAHDTRLDREVALKFLPTYRNASPAARERFLAEARAAAALEHPNVCSVHEIGETAEGWPFIAMACYAGETLGERLVRGRIPPAEAAGISVQLARGLKAAHARGIVHRDVKPGNIMLGDDGMVRLLDFGVAKIADLSLTDPGVTPGTVAYMSPEHTRGDPVGPATDLWSLGVVLYEMLSGKRPFRGGNDRAVIQAILHEEPEPLSANDVRPGLNRVVKRLLRKAPEERYRNADEVLEDLAREEISGDTRSPHGWMPPRRRVLAAGAAAALLAVTLLFVPRPAGRSAAVTPPDSLLPPAIAILPFTVHGADLEVWREGMVDLLSMGLDGTGGIRAIDSRTLLARWHQDAGAGRVGELAQALGIARETGAQYALVGSAAAAGQLIRLRADVYDVETGASVGPVQVEGPRDSMLTLVDRLGIQTLGLILEKDSGELPSIDLAAITTPSLIALKNYLDGENHYRHAEFEQASAAWTRAAQADTLFALAWYGLVEAQGWHSGGVRAYWEKLERAGRLSDRLPELERTLLQVRTSRLTDGGVALSTLRNAARKYPDAAEVWYELGESYHHDATPMAAPGEAEAAFRRALALAFGDAGARSEARSELAALDGETAMNLYLLLAHPRFAEVREAAFPVIAQRLDPTSRAQLRHPRVLNVGLMDGRARHALRILDEPPMGDAVWYCGPLYLADRGLPVPDQVLEQRIAASRADSALFASAGPVMCAAQLAAWTGDWARFDSLLSRAQTIADRERAAGNRLSVAQWELAILDAKAHGLWRRGRTEEALHAFRGTETGRSLWYVGTFSLELGRLDDAERAFRALLKRDGTAARLQLARILERTNRPEEAREAYLFVADAWRNADPELQPAVQEARQAAARLARAAD